MVAFGRNLGMLQGVPVGSEAAAGDRQGSDHLLGSWPPLARPFGRRRLGRLEGRVSPGYLVAALPGPKWSTERAVGTPEFP